MIAFQSPGVTDLCLCCSSTELLAEPTLTSLFLSRRAWGGNPEQTDLLYCRSCGFRWYRRLLSTLETASYYARYRDPSYLVERSRDELFYSKKAFDKDETWMASPIRRAALGEAIRSFREIRQMNVLDYGGGDGRLIAELDSARKVVFDLSDVEPLPGIERIRDESALRLVDWHLIVCAQVLEHVSAPHVFLSHLVGLAMKGGLIYVELPSQQWKSYAYDSSIRNAVLRRARRHRRFHKWLDLYSTAFRILCGVLPPFGFVPMREHVNFFTLQATLQLGSQLGLEPLLAQVHPFCGIQVLFEKA